MTLFESLKVAKTMLFTSMLTAGSAAYVLVLIVLITYRNTSFNRPFYHICLSMAANDIAGIIYMACHTILMPNYGGSYLWTRISGYSTNVIWFGLELHQLLIAINRCVGVFRPFTEATIFTRRRVNLALAFIWVFTICSNLMMLTTPLSYVYYGPDMMFFNFSYPQAVRLNMVRDLGFQPATFLVILIVYVAAGLKVRSSHNRMQKPKLLHRETDQVNLQLRLLFQGVLVTIPQFLCVCLHHLIHYNPTFSPNLRETLIFLSLLFAYLSYTINPYIYICFNSELRNKIAGVIAGSQRRASKYSRTGTGSNSFEHDTCRVIELTESKALLKHSSMM